jgi:small basic protein (TIGR04137 family)
MSVDRTLHIRSGGTQKRNVLSRAERIAMLAEGGEVDLDALNPLGLTKTKVRVSKAGTKSKKEEKPAEGAEGVPAAEGAAPAAGKEGAAAGAAKPAAKPAGKAEGKPGKGEAKAEGKGKK